MLIPGRGFLHGATKNITSAQLKALGTVPAIIAPAQGPNLLAIPVQADLLYHFGTIAYANLAATNEAHDLALTIGGIAVTHWMSSRLTMLQLNDRATFMYPNDATDANGLPDTGSNFLPNESIQLWNWSGSNYTNGNGTLTISILYKILNVLTGQYK